MRGPSRAFTRPCSTRSRPAATSRETSCAPPIPRFGDPRRGGRRRPEVSDHYLPKTRAYHEIWYGEEKVAGSDEQEPFYGATYLPRKFKIGFVVPPSNDIDVYTQDLGFIAIAGPDGLEGYNVAIGGGMGRTENEPPPTRASPT